MYMLYYNAKSYVIILMLNAAFIAKVRIYYVNNKLHTYV